MQVAVRPSAAVAVMVARPAATAETVPSALTVATALLLVDQATLSAPVAFMVKVRVPLKARVKSSRLRVRAPPVEGEPDGAALPLEPPRQSGAGGKGDGA